MDKQLSTSKAVENLIKLRFYKCEYFLHFKKVLNKGTLFRILISIWSKHYAEKLSLEIVFWVKINFDVRINQNSLMNIST